MRPVARHDASIRKPCHGYAHPSCCTALIHRLDFRVVLFAECKVEDGRIVLNALWVDALGNDHDASLDEPSQKNLARQHQHCH